MNKSEKELFRCLCSFKESEFDESLLNFATPEVLGQLFFNRMQAVAYGTLKKHGLLGKVNREFRNSLGAAYEQNLVKNKSLFSCIQLLNDILSDCGCRYAMLKGAFLCRFYPAGYRTSNDVDLLVLPKDVTTIGNKLLQAGFMQGHIRNGTFQPATRKEIVESRMMRGETVPYIKEVSLPGMKYLEVDINFSLDYKPSDTDVLESMLARAYTRNVNKLPVTTLDNTDFFIYLCSHLYKEATTLPWVEMKRDMTMYKYADIYMLMHSMNIWGLKKIMERAKELEMDKICAFAIVQTSALFAFHNDALVNMAKNILEQDPQFIHTVFSPQEKAVYHYSNEDIAGRFFAKDRKKLLMKATDIE